VCTLIFSRSRVWNIFHSENNSARYYQKYTYVFKQSSRYSYQSLTKLKFSHRIFEKYFGVKFHENLSNGSRVVPCGRRNVTKLIVAFRGFANASKNLWLCCLTLYYIKLHIKTTCFLDVTPCILVATLWSEDPDAHLLTTLEKASLQPCRVLKKRLS
jgi:hypothetical protein